MSMSEKKMRQFKAERIDNGKKSNEGILHKTDKQGNETVIRDDSWLHKDAGVRKA